MQIRVHLATVSTLHWLAQPGEHLTPEQESQIMLEVAELAKNLRWLPFSLEIALVPASVHDLFPESIKEV